MILNRAFMHCRKIQLINSATNSVTSDQFSTSECASPTSQHCTNRSTNCLVVDVRPLVQLVTIHNPLQRLRNSSGSLFCINNKICPAWAVGESFSTFSAAAVLRPGRERPRASSGGSLTGAPVGSGGSSGGGGGGKRPGLGAGVRSEPRHRHAGPD